MSFRTLDQAEAAGKTALVRVDFNVPMQDGQVSDDTRLRAALPTINRLREAGAKVVLLAHFDRPKGERVPSMSLKPLIESLGELIGGPVRFADECVGEPARTAIADTPAGGVVLLENVRFHKGEEKNDPAFAAQLAELGDLYVNDAFSAAHRAHASTESLAHLLPAYAGESMRRELEALDLALGSPQRPVMGIVGGAKVSSKLELLENLVGKLDYLAIGGGMANTFLHAQGHEIGASLCEKDMAATAREILLSADQQGCTIILPLDVVVAHDLAPGAASRTIDLEHVGETDRIFDVGPLTIARIVNAMAESKTLIWNGPLGVFEVPPFDRATVAAAKEAAVLARAGRLIAVAGGGDTVSALHHADVASDFTFVSTAGGAFLEWMEGKALPGVEALRS
jgi:phosphoglycerate kinase